MEQIHCGPTDLLQQKLFRFEAGYGVVLGCRVFGGDSFDINFGVIRQLLVSQYPSNVFLHDGLVFFQGMDGDTVLAANRFGKGEGDINAGEQGISPKSVDAVVEHMEGQLGVGEREHNAVVLQDLRGDDLSLAVTVVGVNGTVRADSFQELLGYI